MSEICSVETCTRAVEIKVHKLCRPHYKRLKRHGSPTGGAHERVRATTFEERKNVFLSRYAETPSGCLEYTRARDENGYGRVVWEGKSRLAHRVMYELLIGPIPAGMNVLHRCDNPPCGKPDHLFVGTQRDNVVDMHSKGRGFVPAGVRKQVCIRGHDLTNPENIYTSRGGRRECRPCIRIRTRERSARKR